MQRTNTFIIFLKIEPLWKRCFRPVLFLLRPFFKKKKPACAFFSGSWKEKTFKPYNFEALGVAPDCGHLHPLMKVRTQFRQIFLEMG